MKIRRFTTAVTWRQSIPTNTNQKQTIKKRTTQKMLLQAAVSHPLPSLLPNQALAYFDFVQCVSSQYFYILIVCYFYSSASIHSKAVYMYIYVCLCVYLHVHIPPRLVYIKPAKEWICPILNNSTNTLFLFNILILPVFLLLLNHANVIINLIT